MSGPIDVWLIDAEGDATLVTAGSDWCLIVADGVPHEGHDAGEWGRVEVARADEKTPFAAHLGETVLAVHEVSEPGNGRRRVDFTFESGDVRCEVLAGELRLSAG
ncbi:hypothetical protein [Streptomyces sp. NBRC 109706]|uniref:hypothetical protein n=1 Tax=Streptomyces sp. NBRC 109706 TaxID=1550035 RepID=UPI001F3E1CD2|nr:hypothetical protein [Streptomyces sp. NBRC 109706]